MRCIGIMTGNSLDAVDVVITDFNDDRINDVGSFSLPVPQAMAAEFRLLKQALQSAPVNFQSFHPSTRLDTSHFA